MSKMYTVQIGDPLKEEVLVPTEGQALALLWAVAKQGKPDWARANILDYGQWASNRGFQEKEIPEELAEVVSRWLRTGWSEAEEETPERLSEEETTRRILAVAAQVSNDAGERIELAWEEGAQSMELTLDVVFQDDGGEVQYRHVGPCAEVEEGVGWVRQKVREIFETAEAVEVEISRIEVGYEFRLGEQGRFEA